MELQRKAAAEFLGTLWLVLGGCGSAVLAANFMPDTNLGIGLVGVSLAFGLTVLTAAYAMGHISGGHFNPAVTVGMILDKRTTPIDGVGYIVAQVIGAIGAAALLVVTVNQAAVTAGITQPGTGITDIGALILETVFTAGFLAVILAATKRAPALAPLAIPLTLVAIHFAIAPLSGSSVNPARSIGSAVIGGDISSLWIYLIGPTVGGILGWAIWRVVDGGEETATT